RDDHGRCDRRAARHVRRLAGARWRAHRGGAGAVLRRLRAAPARLLRGEDRGRACLPPGAPRRGRGAGAAAGPGVGTRADGARARDPWATGDGGEGGRGKSGPVLQRRARGGGGARRGRVEAARRGGRRMTGSGAGGGTVATVGTFDGIHRGHQAVLAEIVRRARAGEGGEGRGGLESLLVPFAPHPLEVLNPSAAPRLPSRPGEKRALVRALGVARIEIVPFTPELARLGPEEFVRDVLRAEF